MAKKIEIFRAFVPNDKVVGANSGQHYMTIRNKLKYLDSLAKNVADGSLQVAGFDGQKAKKSLPENMRIKEMHLEMWKCDNRLFDLMNYNITFKSIIDEYTSLGYWEDDNWNFFPKVSMNGGGKRNWNREDAGRFKYENDGLPENEEDLYSFWEKECGDISSFLVRLILVIED